MTFDVKFHAEDVSFQPDFKHFQYSTGGGNPEDIAFAILEHNSNPNAHPDIRELLENAGPNFETDETLTLENGILSVNTTDAATEEDTRPITSQGVYNEFAVIHALLKTI